jgi:hypothetical protein
MFAIQPLSMGWGEQPSAPVAAAIPAVTAAIRDLINRWQLEA